MSAAKSAWPIPSFFPKERTQARNRAQPSPARPTPNNVISVSVIVKRKNPLNIEELGGRHLSQEEFSEKYAADPASFDQSARICPQERPHSG